MTRSLNEGGRPPRTRHIIGDRYTTYGHRDDAEEAVSGTMALGRLVIFVAFLGIIWFLVRTLPHVFTILDANVENKFVLALIGSLGSLVVGVGLYHFRERKRMLYSLMEMAVGFVTGGVAIVRVRNQGDLSVWLGLSASAYLVVRGLDNFQKAKDQRTVVRESSTEPEQLVGPERRERGG